MKRALALVLLAACGTGSVAPAHAPPPAADPAAFERGEDEVLRDLAAIDMRFARRARIEPAEDDLRRVAMAAILHEDPTLAVNDGAIDPFSFDARARGLEAIKAKLASLPGVAANGPGASERDLLARVVAGEVARLDEERALPRSASALVRAVVDTWRSPRDEREAAEDDRWLARRLRELRESMTSPEGASPAGVPSPSTQLDVVRARDLDDALDALERLCGGMVKTTQELVKTREALESIGSKPAAAARSDWLLVAQRLRAQVGVTATAEELTTRFDALEKDLRTRADEAVNTAGLDRRSLSADVDKLLFASGPCVNAVPGSRVRSLTAPYEREAACHLEKAIANANDPAARALALTAMHDHVVVAQWALDVAAGRGAIKEAEGTHHMLVPLVQPSIFARLERIALARPASAIGTGFAVSLLAKGDPEARARAWTALGDLPLDFAERELQ